MDKISVIIPVYNTKLYFNQCLDSVLAQTYENLEIILIDDGSNDGSGDLCDAYAKKDSRIVVIHQENQGQSVARNRGLDCCTGNYIAFVDSDDYLDCNAYETLWKLCKEAAVPIAWMQMEVVCETGASLSHTVSVAPRISSKRYLEILLQSEQYASVWDKFYHKTVVQQIRFYEGVVNEDFRFLLDLFSTQKWHIATTDYVGYSYRKRCGSTVNRPFGQLEIDGITNAIYAESVVEACFPDLMTSAKGHTLFKVATLFTKIPMEQAVIDYPLYAYANDLFQNRKKELATVVLPLKFRVFLRLCVISIPFAKRVCTLYQRCFHRRCQ